MSQLLKSGEGNFEEEFIRWFVRYSEQKASSEQVNQVVRDHTGFTFLMVWNLFESRCFKCNFDQDRLECFTKNVSITSSFDKVQAHWDHFHKRYTHKKLGDERVTNLFFNPKRKSAEKSADEKKFRTLTGPREQGLTASEKVWLITKIVQRFRNNIFHGNKRPYTWPFYREQIEHCIQTVMVWLDVYVPDV
jgi:hypothetical protein